MPPGDLITGDFQVEIQGLLTGDGTDYELGPQAISGLGEPKPKTRDFTLQGQAGSIGAGDYSDVRVVLIDYVVCARCEVVSAELTDESVETAIANMQTLAAAWAPVADPAGVELHFQLPGFRRYLVGFPRGIEFDEGPSLFVTGRGGASVTGVAEFHAMIPAFQTP
jgi:hypothetical protein